MHCRLQLVFMIWRIHNSTSGLDDHLILMPVHTLDMVYMCVIQLVQYRSLHKVHI